MTPTTEARERVLAVRALLDSVRRGKADMGDVLTGSIAMLDMAAEWLAEDDGNPPYVSPPARPIWRYDGERIGVPGRAVNSPGVVDPQPMKREDQT